MPPLFVLTPATLAWSPLFAGYYGYLSMSVSLARLGSKVIFGEPPKDSDSTSPEQKKKNQTLRIATRCHSNFGEYVPLTLLLLTAAEINGAPTALVHSAYALFFTLRVLHVEFGLKGENQMGPGRRIGALGSYAFMVAAGLYNGWLGLDTTLTFLGIRR